MNEMIATHLFTIDEKGTSSLRMVAAPPASVRQQLELASRGWGSDTPRALLWPIHSDCSSNTSCVKNDTNSPLNHQAPINFCWTYMQNRCRLQQHQHQQQYKGLATNLPQVIEMFWKIPKSMVYDGKTKWQSVELKFRSMQMLFIGLQKNSKWASCIVSWLGSWVLCKDAEK